MNISGILPHGTSPGDIAIIFSGVMCTVVVAIVLSRSIMVRDTTTPRIKALLERRAMLKANLMTPRRRVRKKAGIDTMRNVVNRLQLLKQEQTGKLTQLLIHAGWRSKDAIYIFLFFQLVAPFIFLLLSIPLVKPNFAHPLTPLWKPLMIIGLGYLGLKSPNILASNAMSKRYHAIQKGLPDALDLMLICAEAGLSLGASLERVSRELSHAYPEIADELGITSVELGFLPVRKKALQNLADRVGLQEVRGIVSVLIQTEKYGTPVSQALRVLSAEFRGQRMMRAEQKAARLPAIMTVPMIVFILPTLFIIVMSPAIIRVMDTWK